MCPQAVFGEGLHALTLRHTSDQFRGLGRRHHRHIPESCPHSGAEALLGISALASHHVLLEDRLDLLGLHTHTSHLDLPIGSPNDFEVTGPPPTNIASAVQPSVLSSIDPLLSRELVVLPIARSEHATKANLPLRTSWHWCQGRGRRYPSIGRRRLFCMHHINLRMRLWAASGGFGGEDGQVDALLRHCEDRATAFRGTVKVVHADLRQHLHSAVRQGARQGLAHCDDVVHRTQRSDTTLSFVDVQNQIQDLRCDHECAHLVLSDHVRQILRALVASRRCHDHLGAQGQRREHLPLDDRPEVRGLEQRNGLGAHLALPSEEVDAVHEVAVVVDDSLRLSGSSGGVNEQCHVIGLRSLALHWLPDASVGRVAGQLGTGCGAGQVTRSRAWQLHLHCPQSSINRQ
mmetsp:Transcript_104494/g.334984  ORF Transcript_104494/g.334984 Transcript_104494/m.334984 type:complete len:403 (-) Transcript_104494:885-2093(-)